MFARSAPWKPWATVRQTVIMDAARMNASSFPGLWTMKIRLYRRNMTAAAATIVNEIVTPRTAAGLACPERPIFAIVGYRVLFRSLKTRDVVPICSSDNKVDVKLQAPTAFGRHLGLGC